MLHLKSASLAVAILLTGCSPEWRDGPYQVYWIDGTRHLGFNLGGGAFINRIDKPKSIEANEKYVSVYACPEGLCGYFYIDRAQDHKHASSTEFVFGPYTRQGFLSLQEELSLPHPGR